MTNYPLGYKIDPKFDKILQELDDSVLLYSETHSGWKFYHKIPIINWIIKLFQSRKKLNINNLENYGNQKSDRKKL